VKAQRAILDGEIVALDDKGLPSFSLMQQRTGFQPGKRRLPRLGYLPGQGASVVYYAFDLLYLDGFDLRRVTLEQRKQLLQERIVAGDVAHFSDHYFEKGLDLFEAAKQRELEGMSPRNAAAFMKRSVRAIAEDQKSRSGRSVSSEATPIPRAAAIISARSCLACLTRRGG